MLQWDSASSSSALHAEPDALIFSNDVTGSWNTFTYLRVLAHSCWVKIHGRVQRHTKSAPCDSQRQHSWGCGDFRRPSGASRPPAGAARVWPVLKISRGRRKAPGPSVNLRDTAGAGLQPPSEHPVGVSAERARAKQTRGCATGPEAPESHTLTSRHRTSPIQNRGPAGNSKATRSTAPPPAPCGMPLPRTVRLPSNFRRWRIRLAFW